MEVTRRHLRQMTLLSSRHDPVVLVRQTIAVQHLRGQQTSRGFTGIRLLSMLVVRARDVPLECIEAVVETFLSDSSVFFESTALAYGIGIRT